MTNKERQKSLDKKKQLESEKAGTDLSGKMDYCRYCLFQRLNGGGCACTREHKEFWSLCAKAYNLMIKRRAK